jgi:hypothetical protein
VHATVIFTFQGPDDTIRLEPKSLRFSNTVLQFLWQSVGRECLQDQRQPRHNWHENHQKQGILTLTEYTVGRYQEDVAVAGVGEVGEEVVEGSLAGVDGLEPEADEGDTSRKRVFGPAPKCHLSRFG